MIYFWVLFFLIHCSQQYQIDFTTRNLKYPLGQERADFAKAYLHLNGILERRVNTDSDDSKEIIVRNDAEKERAKIRKTEFAGK